MGIPWKYSPLTFILMTFLYQNMQIKIRKVLDWGHGSSGRVPT
jgi:hypothetical protein